MFKLKHIQRLPTTGSPAMARGNTIHKIGEDTVKLPVKAAIPPEYATLKAEIKFLRGAGAIAEEAWGFKADWSWIGRKGWFGDDVWFRAKADVLVLYDDNTALVGDWKTGRRYETNKDQVNLFALATFKRYDVDEVDTRLWYTDQPADDNEVRIEYKRSEMPAIQKDWERKVRPMFADRKFAPKPGPRCRWCDFSKAEGGPCQF